MKPSGRGLQLMSNLVPSGGNARGPDHAFHTEVSRPALTSSTYPRYSERLYDGGGVETSTRLEELVVKHNLHVMAGTLSLDAPVVPRRKFRLTLSVNTMPAFNSPNSLLLSRPTLFGAPDACNRSPSYEASMNTAADKVNVCDGIERLCKVMLSIETVSGVIFTFGSPVL